MKQLSITLGTILLVLGCFALSLGGCKQPVVVPIVGMWSVHYVSTTGGPEAFSYDQWHSDGLDIETR